ncbi:MAG: glycerophosphodiester phosphodiesterase family protein [Armatimonadota bacterium]|nr:MAG: glycerophosphodiester phosphodiesterase family protein [Armatimonadota bacterium]
MRRLREIASVHVLSVIAAAPCTFILFSALPDSGCLAEYAAEFARAYESRGGPALVIGHRGAPTEAPENTLAAFRKALDLGAHGVELDVRLTADGHLVIMHDDTVDRTTDGTGAVADMTLEQIRSLSAGGETVPTLHEALQTVAPRGEAMLDLKFSGTSERWRELVEKTVAVIEELRCAKSVRFLIYDWNAVPLVKEHPGIRLYLDIYRTPPGEVIERFGKELANPDHCILYAWWDRIEFEQIREAHQLGFRICIFHPSGDVQGLENLLRMGADAILTDHTRLLLDLRAEIKPG